MRKTIEQFKATYPGDQGAAFRAYYWQPVSASEEIEIKQVDSTWIFRSDRPAAVVASFGSKTPPGKLSKKQRRKLKEDAEKRRQKNLPEDAPAKKQAAAVDLGKLKS